MEQETCKNEKRKFRVNYGLRLIEHTRNHEIKMRKRRRMWILIRWRSRRVHMMGKSNIFILYIRRALREF